MQSQARVVVIGGGMMGAGLLYHLAEEGWSDILLVEKGELTSGSTWQKSKGRESFTWPRTGFSSTMRKLPYLKIPEGCLS